MEKELKAKISRSTNINNAESEDSLKNHLWFALKILDKIHYFHNLVDNLFKDIQRVFIFNQKASWEDEFCDKFLSIFYHFEDTVPSSPLMNLLGSKFSWIISFWLNI